MESLEEVIRRHVLLGKRSAKGYEQVRCAKCNDHKARGGFKFDAGSIHFSCFNCSTSVGYDPHYRNRHGQGAISKGMREVLSAFGIPDAELDRVVAQSFFKERVAQEPLTPEQKKLAFPVDEVRLPTGSVPISSDDSPWCEVAREYVRSRGLDPAAHPFHVTDETAYLGRLLIPYSFRGRTVYWQGRAMDPSIQPRYKNPIAEHDNVFFNMDEVYDRTDAPLFVCEGAIDALSVGQHGVALAGSKMTQFHVRELKRIAILRKVVFVIDKKDAQGNGYKLGTRVLDEEVEGWYVTCMPDNISDANDGLQRMGRLWLTTHLATTAVQGFAGRLMLEMHCK